MNITPIQTKLKLILLTLLSVSALNFSVYAQNNTFWTNTGTGDWSDPSNWDNGVPNDTDSWGRILNGGTAVISSSVSYFDLDIGTYAPGSGALLITSTGSARAFEGFSVDFDSSVVVNDRGYWDLSQASYSDFHGSLLITDSGSVNSATSDSKGSITVSGNAYWQVNNLNISNITASAPASLAIIGSGSVQSNYATFGNGPYSGAGNVLVSDDGHWEVAQLSSGGTASLTITGNGSVHVSGSAALLGSNVSISDNGSLEVDGRLEVGHIILSGTVRANQISVYDYIKAGAGGSIYDANTTIYADSSYLYTGGITFRAGERIELDGMDLIYTGEALLLEGAANDLIITSDFWVDFSQVTLADGQSYVIIDWSGLAAQNVQIDATFDISSVGTEGTFAVQSNQLVFTTNAIPEPSTWFLLGTGFGVLLLTSRRRRNVQS